MSAKFSETQRALLSGAAQRDDRHLSLPGGAKLVQARKAAARLLEAGLVKEVKARKDAPVWRRDQNAGQDYSLKLTAAGLKATAPDDGAHVADPAPQAPGGDALANEAARAAANATKTAGSVEPDYPELAPISPRVGTKIGEVVTMLEGESGATLDQLVAATGWLPHTTRAALTGLRKRGYQVTIDRSDNARGSVYRITDNEAKECGGRRNEDEAPVAAEPPIAEAAKPRKARRAAPGDDSRAA